VVLSGALIERRYQSRLAPGGEDLGTNGARETERR